MEALEPWFHQIDLGHGIKTKSRPAATEPIDHPNGSWQIIRRCFPDDLVGQSVLDVGCNGGFFAIAAKRRNAQRVVGIDSQRWHINQARFASRVLDLDIEYERMSVYDLSPQRVGRFDVTLALGLIYHCKHVILALERLFEVTKNRLIIESAVFPSSLLFESFSEAAEGGGRRCHAVAYVENEPSCKEAVFNWFIPTVDCLKAMLQDVGFVDVHTISEQNGRAVIVCRSVEPDSLTMPRLLAAQLVLLEGTKRCRPGSPINFRVSAKNTGQSTWLTHQDARDKKGGVRLAVHLLDESGEEIIKDCGGAPIPHRVTPGSELILDFTLRAPSRPGRYLLQLDMLSENLTWFEDAGATIPPVVAVDVE